MTNFAVILTAFLFCVGESQARDTLFVSSAVITPGDGRRWERAFSTLHEAIRLSKDGDEIWVARGTYVVGAEGINISRNIKLFGGFAGGEVRREFRDWYQNRTVIQAQSNAAPVLTITGTNRNTEIDGFYVQGAPHRAFLLDGSSCVISNTIFRGNTSQNGGAVLIVKNSAPTFRFCVFEHNVAEFDGGAVSVEGSPGYELTTARFENCFFDRNSAGKNGGAISVNNSNLEVVATSSVFVENTSLTGGGLSVVNAKGTVTHCTMFNNMSGELLTQGRSIHLEGLSFFTLRNSILWSQTDSPLPHLYIGINLGPQPQVEVQANIIQRDFYRGAWQDDPLFLNPLRASGYDRVWGTPDDGLQLQQGSYAIDRAYFSSQDLQYSSDAISRPRSSMARADIGAYEVQRTSYLPTAKVQDLLKSGNVVLVFRNAPVALRDEFTPSSCLDALTLSSTGRQRIAVVERALQALTLPVSESITATSCVSWETALGIAGFIDKDSTWNVEFDGDVSKRELDVTQQLNAGPRIIVAEQPVVRTLAQLEQHELREGDALVFDNSQGSLQPVAQITLDGWRVFGLADVPTSVHQSGTTQRPILVRNEFVMPACETGNAFVVDVTGRQVYSSNSLQASVVSTLGWPPGLYLIIGHQTATPILVLP